MAALLLGVAYAAQAQDSSSRDLPKQYSYNPFRIDVGVGLSFPVTTFGIGILGSIEPQYSFGPFAVGARVEYHIEGNENEQDGSITKYNNAMLLTGDYRFSSGTYRPFVGAGLGSYLTAATFLAEDSYSGNNDQYHVFGQKIGGMFRAGFDLPHFRFALQCNITGGDTYLGRKVNFSYLSFAIAVGIGGGRIR